MTGCAAGPAAVPTALASLPRSNQPYSTGSTSKVSEVDENSPPMTTTASGRVTDAAARLHAAARSMQCEVEQVRRVASTGALEVFEGTSSPLRWWQRWRRVRAPLRVVDGAGVVRLQRQGAIVRASTAGATEVVPEALESSLMLASHALVVVGVPLRRVVHRVQSARDERYAALRGYFHGSSDVSDDAEHMYVRLHSVVLGETAQAVGRRIDELGLDELEAEVSGIRRARNRIEPAPETQGLPMPRATTAACEVMPPRVVRMPSAACMPWMSSGEVSTRTRIHLRSALRAASASSELKTISPVAAPGEAGRPAAMTLRSAFGSMVGCRS